MYTTILKYNEGSLGKMEDLLYREDTNVTIDFSNGTDSNETITKKYKHEDFKYIVCPYVPRVLTRITNVTAHTLKRCLMEDDYVLSLENRTELMLLAENIEDYNLDLKLCPKAIKKYITFKNYPLYERFLSEQNRKTVYNYIVKQGL